MSEPSVGVYVHVPFCERVCPYCDFAVVAARPLAPATEARTVAALRAELAARREAFAGRRLASVYLGGGTPSLLHPESVAALVEAVRAAFPAPDPAVTPAPGSAAPDTPGGSAGAAEPEITLEVNPSTVERARLPGFRAAGVNRLSVGVQSFDDAVLRRLGRAHQAETARETLAAARAAGFANLSLDLIHGVPGQDVASLERDLAETAAFGPEHVSAYALTVEPGTPYARAVARGQLALPDEERALAQLERVRVRLEAAGLRRYEVSSYARPGREAVHNRRYWARQPVLGLGMGAWSSEPAGPGHPFGARRANERRLEAWLARVEAGAPPPEAGLEVPDTATARGEAAFLALRTAAGLDAAGFAAEFGAPPRHFFADAIARLRAAGLLEELPSGDLRLSAAGWPLADSVAEAFVALPAQARAPGADAAASPSAQAVPDAPAGAAR